MTDETIENGNQRKKLYLYLNKHPNSPLLDNLDKINTDK